MKNINTFKNTYPELAAQWHPTKNGNLKPSNVAAKSNKKIWWIYSYDDPVTGKHFDFEWQAKICNRIRDNSCPYLTGHAVWFGYNDLETLNPTLASQWHPTKNGNLKPSKVTVGSKYKAWWLYPYDDPVTGKHFDFEWQATINSRNKGCDCPYLKNKALWKGYNDLETLYPEIAKEWHPTKNGNLKPSDIIAASGKKAWWIYPYDDPVTGKHFDFEWQTTISHRVNGTNCPFLNNKLWKGYNDLETLYPEIAKEWHPTKNGNLKPSDVAAKSNKKIWWKCFKAHEWQTSINHRTNGTNCPICDRGKHVSFNELAIYYYISKLAPDTISGYNDLGFEIDIFIPSKRIGIEYDGYYWHKDKKETDIKKNKLCQLNKIKLYRIREKLDSLNDDSEDILLVDVNKIDNCILDLIKRIFNQDLKVNISNDRISIYSLIERIKCDNSLENLFPEIAKEWHPTKNGNLKPSEVTFGSKHKVWWLYPYDNPVTGKHFDFEWQAEITNRIQGTGCPYLSNKAILSGFNDLETLNPKLAREWHPTKNGNLKPSNVAAGSDKKVWWLYPYDDPITGKHFDFEWQASITSRNRGTGCPYLINREIWPGFNDLETLYPEVAKEWHPTKNGNLKPSQVTPASTKRVWWIDNTGIEKQLGISYKIKSLNKQ